jgi:hypothetical protein
MMKTSDARVTRVIRRYAAGEIVGAERFTEGMSRL